MLKPVPHRHMVFSLPKRLRPYFKYNRKNCDLLFKAASETVKELFHAVLPEGEPGAVFALQTHGESLNFNPHIHGIVSDGVFGKDGTFHRLGTFNEEKFTELFTYKVLTFLKKREVIHDSVVENILSWKHRGFSVWAGEPINPEDEDSLLFLSRYIDRGPVAGNRISITDDLITYETIRDELTHEFSPVEFLARLTPHVPKKWESTTRYYGEYSHRRRGERRKSAPVPSSSLPSSLELVPKKKASRTWAALIKQVYEVDPLLCKKCGGVMKIIAFIQDPREIKKLLQSLNIDNFHPPPPLLSPRNEEGWSTEPFYDDQEPLIQ